MGRKNKGPQIRQLLAEGVSYSEIVRRVDCAKSTINYQARQMGLAHSGFTYNWREVQEFYDEGNSRRACQQRFGFSSAAGTDAVNRGAVRSRARAMPIETLLVIGRNTTNRCHLKARLLQHGHLVNHCYECGLAEWRGKPISLNLHHINGDGSDNRLENLTLLCPNCHSQTENFSGRNSRNKIGENKRVPKEKTLYAVPSF